MVAFIAQHMMEMILRAISSITKFSSEKFLSGRLAEIGGLKSKQEFHVEAPKVVMLALKTASHLQNKSIIQKK